MACLEKICVRQLNPSLDLPLSLLKVEMCFSLLRRELMCPK